MRRMSFALALMAVLGFGSLFIETASAQNSNNSNMNSNMGGHRRHAKHRRHRRHKRNTMAPKNANQ